MLAELLAAKGKARAVLLGVFMPARSAPILLLVDGLNTPVGVPVRGRATGTGRAVLMTPEGSAAEEVISGS